MPDALTICASALDLGNSTKFSHIAKLLNSFQKFMVPVLCRAEHVSISNFNLSNGNASLEMYNYKSLVPKLQAILIVKQARRKEGQH